MMALERTNGRTVGHPGPMAAILVIALAAAFPAAAETSFSGEIKPEVIFNIPGSGGYTDTPLNPNNEWGYDDLMFRNQIDLKLNSRGETGAMDLWVQFKQYPIGDLLTGSAALAEALEPGLAGYSAAVGDLFYLADPYIYTLNIMQASVDWQPLDSLKLTLGRQSFLTGYGYGWNPVDLANPPKDPTDPTAYLRGVDALTFLYSPAAWMNAKLYGALPSEGYAWDYSELLAGGEITFYAPALEFKIAGLWGGVESSTDTFDRYPHAVAAAAFVDLFGLGIYGEAAIRSRSRRNDPDPAGGSSTPAEGPVLSALGGMEYYFPSGMLTAVEYFFNGEGWDNATRQDYVDALFNGGVTGEYSILYTPTYFGKHYLLVNFMIPWYAVETTFNINTIWGIDSATLILTPNASVNLNYEGTLVSEIWYSGQFSFDDSKNGEAALSPVRHSVWFNLRYFF